MKLKIEYLPLHEIKAYPNNAKVHTEEQIEQIKKSILEFGMNDPIAIWKDNEVIEGHGRLIALTELGYTEAPVIRLDSLTDEQRKAYMLVHNKLTMNTGFDFNILDSELAEICSLNMDDFGFELAEGGADDYTTDFSLPEGGQSDFRTKTLTLHYKQLELIDSVIAKAKEEVSETFGNGNADGNAIYEVCKQWAEQKI